MDLESKLPMAEDAVFRIASMTKPVTGMAIMMMMEEGKLRITDPVSKFIPEFKDMKVAVAPPGQGPPPAAGGQPRRRFYTVPAERQITIRDLLTHTSGLASGPMGNSDVRKSRARRRDAGRLHSAAGPDGARVPAGARRMYSAQAGMDTLGRIVEITSGQPFDQFLRQRVFDPLGMKEISFYPTETLEPRMPTVYQGRQGPKAEKPESELDVQQGLFHGIGRPDHDRRGLRQVRADAA